MSWLSNLKNFTLSLTDRERFTFYKAFGSFRANLFALAQDAFLKHGYEENVDVYSVLRKIIDSALKARIVVEEMQSDGTLEILENTDLHTFFRNVNKAKGYSIEDIWEQWLVYMLATGNSYTYGLESVGFNRFASLDVMPSYAMHIDTTNNLLDPQPQYELRFAGRTLKFQEGEIEHSRYFNPHYTDVQQSMIGLSPIQVAAMVVQSGNDRWHATASLHQNRGAIGMITDSSKFPMKDSEAEAVQQHWDNVTAGPSKFGRIKVTNKDLKFIQMAMSPSDLKLIETGVVNVRTICNLYSVDSSLFNDPENKTFANRTKAEKALYENAVIPLNNRFFNALNKWLVPGYFPDNSNVRVRGDYSHIEALQEDFNVKARTYAVMKTAGIISANTAAAALDQPQSDDENADKLIVSTSNQLLEDLGKGETEGSTEN